MMMQTYTENMVGNDYVVGDIHGTFTRLQKFLDKIGFNPEVDRLFSVGDLVDRGPESHLVLEWLAKPWFIPIMGNHEEMAVDYHLEPNKTAIFEQDYKDNGGAWNVKASYATTSEVSRLFSKLPVAITYLREGKAPIGLVHADCPLADWDRFASVLSNPQDPWFTHIFKNALWDRRRPQGLRHDTIRNVDYIVVGHTPVPRPTMIDNVLMIDTGAVFTGDGHFTLHNLKTGELISETGGFKFCTDNGYEEEILGNIELDDVIGDDVICTDGQFYACYYGDSKQFFRTIKVVSDTGGPDLMVWDSRGYRIDLMSKFGIDFYELTTPARQGMYDE